MYELVSEESLRKFLAGLKKPELLALGAAAIPGVFRDDKSSKKWPAVKIIDCIVSRAGDRDRVLVGALALFNASKNAELQNLFSGAVDVPVSYQQPKPETFDQIPDWKSLENETVIMPSLDDPLVTGFDQLLGKIKGAALKIGILVPAD